MYEENAKRKICFVLTSKIHYGRSRYILEELKNHNDIELRIVVGASAILSQYGNVLAQMQKDGFDCSARITMNVEGGNPVSMAKTAGLGILEFTNVFENLNPDVIIVRGDRYEVLSAAIAAVYTNRTLAHIEGGDISGNIDESVRHAITKLAHYHFTTNGDSKNRVIKMGEREDTVFDFGSPDIEFIIKSKGNISNEELNRCGVGAKPDITKPYIIVMQHPVTSEVGKNRENVTESLLAIKDLGIQAFWFWPNIDAGTDEISKGIRTFRELHHLPNVRFFTHLASDQFIELLKKSSCLVGNSSAGIKECSYLGIPVVNIGNRQEGRTRGTHIIDVDYERNEIANAIKKQLEHGHYSQNNFYHKENTARNIVHVLASMPLYIQKKLNY